jgi:hypothetical protein
MFNQPYAQYYGANIRRVSKYIENRKILVIQKRNILSDSWHDVIDYDEVSNDYAYSESATYASKLAASWQHQR